MDKNISIGRGCIKELASIAEGYRSHLVFSSEIFLPFIKKILETKSNIYDIDYYSDFTMNPKKEEIDIALKILNNDYKVIIAIGGGSVIDFAKLYKYYTGSKAFFIAIPTTAGTGSEATGFAVIYIDGEKKSIEDKNILPDYAIIDSQFLDNSPRYLKACTAFDALSQSIESFWSNQSTLESIEYAKQALLLCRDNIIDYVNHGDKKSAHNMALAAYLSGKAINISKTTAAHALSYSFTSKLGVPHGHAVALSISKLFDANVNISESCLNDKRGISYIKNMIYELTAIINKEFLDTTLVEIGLETDLNKLGANSLYVFLESVNIERLNNNPRKFEKNELQYLFNY
ncbi:MAG: iron-containing alcohol dehydrogenase [Leptospirales bacterium]|nr:iron-containing alcohol dehydrogenase [Leptospirales bacterium]